MSAATAECAVAAPIRALAVWERAVQAAVFLLPLAWWGGAEDGFAQPKLWLLAALNVALALRLVLRRYSGVSSTTGRTGEWVWLAWLAALSLSAVFGRFVSLEALLLALLPLPLAWAASEGLLPIRRVIAALLYGSAVESALAVLQYLKLDPFSLAWRPDVSGSARMRVYGTLGNPDFLAAWLCAALPLYASYAPATKRARLLRSAAFVLQLGAIAATGSRVSLLAFPIAAAVLFWQRGSLRGASGNLQPDSGTRLKWFTAVLLAAVAVAVLWFSPARALNVTVQGRLYLAKVAASQWRHIPVLGYGPGSFRLQFVPWQAEWLQQHRGESDAAAFAGPVDHAHNDYLEFAVEYGPAGLGAFLLLSAFLFYRAWRARAFNLGPRAGVWAAAATLLVIAGVDFPFHRPPEWALYWILLGMLAGRDLPRASGRQPENN